MNENSFLVIAVGAAAIAFVHWYFLMRKSAVRHVAGGIVEITVRGGYDPDTVEIANRERTVLAFTRTDPSSCLEEVVIPDFKTRRFLPLNERVEVPLEPKRPGTFEFACGMNMFKGRIIVR